MNILISPQLLKFIQAWLAGGRQTHCIDWLWGGRGFCLRAEKTQSQCLDKLDNQKMPENAAESPA
jgi:hypothetical protein